MTPTTDFMTPGELYLTHSHGLVPFLVVSSTDGSTLWLSELEMSASRGRLSSRHYALVSGCK